VDTGTPPPQHRYDGLPVLDAAALAWRREKVFLVLAGLFLATLAMLNIVGVSRFADLSFEIPLIGWEVPMVVAIGVLPYPITFLCTDFISELYGRRRANAVVAVGFLVNLWVAFILWIGGLLPQPPGADSSAFLHIRDLTIGTVAASMIAYLAAQLVDVQLFHFWKRLTAGRHLWLRNNGSTLVSQLVDTTAVILIIYPLGALPPVPAGSTVAGHLAALIAASYVFKLVAALVDTGPFYLGNHLLLRYLRLPPPTAEPRES
jgi:hypothetical protein